MCSSSALVWELGPRGQGRGRFGAFPDDMFVWTVGGACCLVLCCRRFGPQLGRPAVGEIFALWHTEKHTDFAQERPRHESTTRTETGLAGKASSTNKHPCDSLRLSAIPCNLSALNTLRCQNYRQGSPAHPPMRSPSAGGLVRVTMPVANAAPIGASACCLRASAAAELHLAWLSPLRPAPVLHC